MGKLIAAGWLVAAAPLALASCAPVYQQAIAAMRRPGERIATTPDRVWREFDCESRARPFVQAESLQLVPERIRPGGRINYRIVYVMCPVQPSQVIAIPVFRKLLHNGQQVASSVKENFEIKPGRWVVDAFFTLPANSPPGVYTLEVSFESPGGQTHKQVRSFEVSDRGYLAG
jgi:hypothetical protein